MFEPSEELFLNKIRENPGDDLPRGIYADWLEEQGDERSVLIRAFNRRDLPVLRRHFWHFYDILESLSHDHLVEISFDFAWTLRELRESERARQLLSHCWLYYMGRYDGEILEDEVADFEGDDSQIYQFLQIYHIATNTSSAFQFARESSNDVCHIRGMDYIGDYSNNYTNMLEQHYLIACSYALFGCNVLPDSFESSGLTNV